MVEVDMPLDYNAAYDREKGQRWGRTLQSSMTSKNGGSHGLAGGFGFGAVQQRGGRKKTDLDDDEAVDWNEAVRQDKVLRTQTLGGQYPDADEVQYMVGVFQGSMFSFHSRFAQHVTNISQRSYTSHRFLPWSISDPNCTTSTQPPNKNVKQPHLAPKNHPAAAQVAHLPAQQPAQST